MERIGIFSDNDLSNWRTCSGCNEERHTVSEFASDEADALCSYCRESGTDSNLKVLMKFKHQPVNLPGSFRWFSGSIVQVDDRICVTRSTEVESKSGRLRILAEYPDGVCNAMAKAIVAQAPNFKNTPDHKVEGRILI